MKPVTLSVCEATRQGRWTGQHDGWQLGIGCARTWWQITTSFAPTFLYSNKHWILTFQFLGTSIGDLTLKRIVGAMQTSSGRDHHVSEPAEGESTDEGQRGEPALSRGSTGGASC